ncbi:14063_t:CDS:2 [Cetraspora pellucida]|uniref:14063_t:CDS:1 n=1 Tax=Cetraspora pellucida TaxID=1433469 RepID=A0ACA9LC30_9GLOM|nr:14063_t:CDS:2 [Cetraspora pellucida]
MQLETKIGSIIRPRRKTMNLGKNLGPPKRIKINEELIQKEKDALNIIPESDSSQNSDSKEPPLPQKTDDNENIQLKKISISCEVKSDNIKQHSSEDVIQEIKVQNAAEVQNQEISKKESAPSPIFNECLSQPSESKLLNATPTPNMNANKDTVLLNGKTYTRTKYIGRGGSSKVYKVIDSDSQVFALKKVSTKKADEQAIKGYLNEVELLTKLAGRDRIIKLYDHEINLEEGYILMVE